MSTPEIRYGFGANWQSFLDHALNEARIANAVGSLRSLLGRRDLLGRTFLDVGCGSGLFSLAAVLMQSPRVVSFDFDPDSVAAARALRDRHGIPAALWEIARGSVLDQEFMASLDGADVVYAWGSLHHTGQMWRAIDAAIAKVRPDGLFAISIYNHVRRQGDRSEMWWHIKKFYNQSPPAVRRLMETAYVGHHVITRLVTLRNPFPTMNDASGTGRRGMDFMHDVRDWLGGFPYEFASAGAVFQYVRDKHGCVLEHLATPEGNACNEFVFRRG